jgi:hypothetical protein
MLTTAPDCALPPAARLSSPAPGADADNPFDLHNIAAYARWRERKLAEVPRSWQALAVNVGDPRHLTEAERAALLAIIAAHNVAVYASPARDEDPQIPLMLGAQLGLHRLDANWLASEHGLSRIEQAEGRRDSTAGRGGFIPYTDRPIRWHTDGYYHPPERQIHGMILHAVRPAVHGGENRLLDPDLLYIALRDANPSHIEALTHAQAMTIPAREDDEGTAREAQAGPVFSFGADGGSLHMRYTARTRSIVWRDDAATQAAVAALEHLLANDLGGMLTLRLEAGMGLVGHNVLHERGSFVDDPARPRLLYRARYLDRVAGPAGLLHSAPEVRPSRTGPGPGRNTIQPAPLQHRQETAWRSG